MWKKLLQDYSVLEHNKLGRKATPPATDEALRTMLKAADLRGLWVPEEYVDFLRIRNGGCFVNVKLYGTYGVIQDDAQNWGELMSSSGPHEYWLDLVNSNEFTSDLEIGTVLGVSDIDWYVSTGSDGPYCRIDRPCGDVIDEYMTCGALLASILKREIDSITRLRT